MTTQVQEFTVNNINSNKPNNDNVTGDYENQLGIECDFDISMCDLEEFAEEKGYLDYCNDSFDHNGDHVQDSGKLSFYDQIQDVSWRDELITDYLICKNS